MAMSTRPGTAPDGPETADLTPKQELAACALAAGCKLRDAAKRSGAGVRTIKRWTAEQPAFRRRVAEYRAEMVGVAVGRLADGMAAAADTLGYLARKAKAETVRLGAARAVIELGVRLRESEELELRIAALEAGAAAGTGRARRWA